MCAFVILDSWINNTKKKKIFKRFSWLSWHATELYGSEGEYVLITGLGDRKSSVRIQAQPSRGGSIAGHSRQRGEFE